MSTPPQIVKSGPSAPAAVPGVGPAPAPRSSRSFLEQVQNSIVHANDLSRVNRAFFDLNGLVSLVYLVAVLAAHPWSRP